MMHVRDGRQVAALSIAGSDSGGNAGLQAAVRAFHTFGLHACTVVAALTAQNPFGVAGVVVPDTDFLAKQLDAVLPVYGIGALKTGMLATREVIEGVAGRLGAVPALPKVVDPVMVATSGAKLLAEDAIGAVRDTLLPLATIATPNLPEAEVLLGRPIRSRDDMLAAARVLHDAYGAAFLVKGGHSAQSVAEDILVTDEGAWWYASPVIEHPASTHGTGCSLSAAIAASLALGRPLPEAVREGKAYVYEAIRTSLPVGERATVLGMPEDASVLLRHPAVHVTNASPS
jgi:hydroxymethylpyrimidine/phosphomethylpyrimidine kinase